MTYAEGVQYTERWTGGVTQLGTVAEGAGASRVGVGRILLCAGNGTQLGGVGAGVLHPAVNAR